MYYTYIIESEQKGRLYVGQTDDVNKRMNQHNDGESKSTKAFKPWKLIYLRVFGTRLEAVRHERYLKSLKNKIYLYKLIKEEENNIAAGWSSGSSAGS